MLQKHSNKLVFMAMLVFSSLLFVKAEPGSLKETGFGMLMATSTAGIALSCLFE